MREERRICGFCTEYDSDNYYCPYHGEKFEEDTCDGFQSDEELTEEEKREVLGDIEAHRKMVED